MPGPEPEERAIIVQGFTATGARFAAFARSRCGFEEFFVQETGVHNGAFGADKFGKKPQGCVRDLGAPQLYQYALAEV